MPGGIRANDFLDRADEALGQRAVSHGDFVDTHGRIAKMWSAYLSVRRDAGAPLHAGDVLAMLGLLKTVRAQVGAFHPDDLVDKIGYAAGEAEVLARMAEQGYFGPSAQSAIEELGRDPSTDEVGSINVTEPEAAGK